MRRPHDYKPEPPSSQPAPPPAAPAKPLFPVTQEVPKPPNYNAEAPKPERPKMGGWTEVTEPSRTEAPKPEPMRPVPQPAPPSGPWNAPKTQKQALPPAPQGAPAKPQQSEAPIAVAASQKGVERKARVLRLANMVSRSSLISFNVGLRNVLRRTLVWSS